MVIANMYTAEQLQELAFTEEELAHLEKARNMPIVFNKNCPPTTPERALKSQTGKSSSQIN